MSCWLVTRDGWPGACCKQMTVERTEERYAYCAVLRALKQQRQVNWALEYKHGLSEAEANWVALCRARVLLASCFPVAFFTSIVYRYVPRHRGTVDGGGGTRQYIFSCLFSYRKGPMNRLPYKRTDARLNVLLPFRFLQQTWLFKEMTLVHTEMLISMTLFTRLTFIIRPIQAPSITFLTAPSTPADLCEDRLHWPMSTNLSVPHDAATLWVALHSVSRLGLKGSLIHVAAVLWYAHHPRPLFPHANHFFLQLVSAFLSWGLLGVLALQVCKPLSISISSTTLPLTWVRPERHILHCFPKRQVSRKAPRIRHPRVRGRTDTHYFAWHISSFRCKFWGFTFYGLDAHQLVLYSYCWGDQCVSLLLLPSEYGDLWFFFPAGCIGQLFFAYRINMISETHTVPIIIIIVRPPPPSVS